MNTPKLFSEQDRENFACQAQKEYMLQQNTIAHEREQEDIARYKVMKQAQEEIIIAQKELIALQKKIITALKKTAKEKQEKQAALDKIAELKKLLANQGPTKKS